MFAINLELIDRAREVLSVHPDVYWILGGAGSGKSTICAELSRMFTIPVHDMDEHIYGAYFARYRPERHPANTAWAAALGFPVVYRSPSDAVVVVAARVAAAFGLEPATDERGAGE